MPALEVLKNSVIGHWPIDSVPARAAFHALDITEWPHKLVAHSGAYPELPVLPLSNRTG